MGLLSAIPYSVRGHCLIARFIPRPLSGGRRLAFPAKPLYNEQL
jgi:hypothetical protein